MQGVFIHMEKNKYHIYQREGRLYGENSYLIVNENQRGFLVDPATDAFIPFIKENEIKLEAIILTHAHSDHILSVDEYAMMYNIPLYIHENEVEKLRRSELNLSLASDPIVVKTLPISLKGKKGKQKIGSFFVTYDLYAGHSEGNILIGIEGEKFYFCGDCVFADSIGRYDLPGSNAREHYYSLQKIMNLPDNIYFYPGHGTGFYQKDLLTNNVLQRFLKLGM